MLCNSITSIFIKDTNTLFLIHQQIPCKSVYHRLIKACIIVYDDNRGVVVGFVRESLAAPESLEAVLCNLRQLNAKMFLALHVERALHNNHNTYKLNLESSKKLVEWMEIA